jgi:hypothetical protein
MCGAKRIGIHLKEMTMSAFEITTEDVRLVFSRHGIELTQTQSEGWFDELETDEIVDSVLYHTNFAQQTDQALSDIEDQLHEAGAFKDVQNYEKQFHVGDDDFYDDEN